MKGLENAIRNLNSLDTRMGDQQRQRYQVQLSLRQKYQQPAISGTTESSPEIPATAGAVEAG